LHANRVHADLFVVAGSRSLSALVTACAMTWALALGACARPAASGVEHPRAPMPGHAPSPADGAPAAEPPAEPTVAVMPAQSASLAPVPNSVLPAYRAGRLKLPPPPPLRDPEPGACRGPTEPGCERCCMKATPQGCFAQRSGSPGAGSPPGYNAGGHLNEGACPTTCKPCARCGLRDEWQLSQVIVPACDCPRYDGGGDPCFVRTSCACVCQQIAEAIENCPHLHPARATTSH